jgi:hypothetical protein
MKLLIDRNGLQARRHLRDRLRPGTFLRELRSTQYLVSISMNALFTKDQLQNCDVFVITTRSKVGYRAQKP